MKRKIKFRGRYIGYHFPNKGKMIYGSLIAYEDNASSLHCFICSQGQEPFHVDYSVDPDSVAQLVGFDADGKEVYEGDVLTFEYDGKHYEYTAGLQPFARNDDGLVHYKFDSLKLKEEAAQWEPR